MRTVRYSKTFAVAFDDLLAQGEPLFGPTIIRSRRQLVKYTVEQFLACHSGAKRPSAASGLTAYPVSRTPFVVLYDFDDVELRVHFIFHRSADLTDLDPASAEW